MIGDEVCLFSAPETHQLTTCSTGLSNRHSTRRRWRMYPMILYTLRSNSRFTIQHVTDPPDSQKNYLVVDSKTENSTIEGAFEQFTRERKDIAILLINQHVREEAHGIYQRPC